MHDAFDSLLDAFNAGQSTKIQRTADDLSILAVNDLLISLKYMKAAGTVMIFTDLGPLPEKDREEYFAMLLEGNHALFATGGATLSCNAALDITALQYLFSVETVDQQQFMTIMENFLSMATLWHRKCEEFRTDNVMENGVQPSAQPAAAPAGASTLASSESLASMFDFQNFLRV